MILAALTATEGAEMTAAQNFRAAWDAWRTAQDKADDAFTRWFTKRQNGEPTNAAQATRLQNEANYLSADLDSAASALYRLDIDPNTVVPEYKEI